MSVWCNREREVVEATAPDPDTLEELQKELDLVPGTIHRTVDPSGLHMMLEFCMCEIEGLVDKYNSLQLPPIVYRDGWEYYRIVSFSSEDGRALFDALAPLGKIEILSKKTTQNRGILDSLVAVNNVFSDMTPRQIEALLKAYLLGYYQLPRSADLAKVAKACGVSRTTLEEHLKKAENKVITAMIPHLRLYAERLQMVQEAEARPKAQTVPA